MLILPDSQSVLHTSPPLMLPAPKIAGLLGSGRHSAPGAQAAGLNQEDNANCLLDSAPVFRPGQDESAFTFTDPRLERLSSDQRRKLFDAAATLLEVAIRFSLDELNDNALRAAASLFARKLTGEPAKHYQNPAHFRAEQDAALLDWLLKVEKRKMRHE